MALSLKMFLTAITLISMLAVLHEEPHSVQYKMIADTVYRQNQNDFTMYWIVAADTVGRPISRTTIEQLLWAGDGQRLRAIRRTDVVSFERRRRIDTLAVTPAGRVETINGDPDLPLGDYDVFLHLPEDGEPLVVGTQWRNVYEKRERDPAANGLYRVERDYRARRLVDTLGTRAMEVLATGSVRFRFSFWIDSAAGTYAWIDVTGPTEETFRFDVDNGQLLIRTWDMDLRGIGGNLALGTTDTADAGLLSKEYRQPIDGQRARLLARDLPGADTSYTVRNGEDWILLHVVDPGADTIASGMVRADGLIGTARSTTWDGAPRRYEVVWTDLDSLERRHRLLIRGDSLFDFESGAIGRVPTEVWAIADYGMEEHLTPVLLNLASGASEQRVIVYRPFAEAWDTLFVSTRTLDSLVLARWKIEDGVRQLLIADDGTLLLQEDSGPSASCTRIPKPGTALGRRLERILGQNNRR